MDMNVQALLVFGDLYRKLPSPNPFFPEFAFAHQIEGFHQLTGVKAWKSPSFLLMGDSQGQVHEVVALSQLRILSKESPELAAQVF